MTENETFDPVRSAAIRGMLVNTVARDAASPRQRRTRIALITSLAVAAVVLAGGSTAWALGLRPFPAVAPTPTPTHTAAPVTTPTPTPTATPTTSPVQSLDPPSREIGVGCDDVGTAGRITSVLRSPKRHTTPGVWPELAAQRETGFEGCYWTGSGSTQLSAEVSTDVATGQASIASDLAHGNPSAHLGDVSSQRCEGSRCIYSVIVGPYWAYIRYSVLTATTKAPPSTLKSFVASTVSELRSHPLTGPLWVSPATSWSSVSSCADVHTSPRMSVVFNDPKLGGPTYFGRTGVDPVLPKYLACSWGGSLNIYLAPGAAWGFEATKHSLTPATVVGADAAGTSCGSNGDGTFCSLDVLTDNTWLQLDLGSTHASVADQKARLVKAAEAILAGHAAAG